MTRATIFDAIRAERGKGFTASDVAAIDTLLDHLGIARDGGGEWLDLTVPLVEQFEGLRLTAYPDPGTGGAPWTIGFGSTTDEQGRAIVPGTTWTHERAEARFRTQLADFGKGVDRLLDGKPTTASQKAAMVSLAYNIGLTAFSRSTVLREHLAGNYSAAADAFAAWNKAGGKILPGLTRRRAAEAELYRSGA
jgi:GH24 family phage-related lysozyme (muramidase)